LRALALAAIACAASCGREQPAATTPPPDAPRVDESKAGTIVGRVLVEGPVPDNPLVKMASDPVCMRENKDGTTLETFVVEKGGLNNVFVYIKDGLGNYYFETPSDAVKLDQKGCRYTPHVFGVRVGQPIEISNSDATMHNVHALADVNQEFNIGQAVQGMKHTRTFTAREVMIRFKCDVHNWMSAYAGVLDHPYFAVTSGGGAFELKNVPAGTYTVEAWHEKLGTQTQTVTIAEKESKDLTFKFAAPTTAP
jgi:plastocyanin